MGIKIKYLSYIIPAVFLYCTEISAQTTDIIPTIKWHAENVGNLPNSVDNSTLKYFPPIINQLGGSCAQASNVGYMFTYEINRLLDRDASTPNNRFSYLYAWNLVNDGRDKGSFGPEGLNIAMANGIITEEDFPEQITGYQFYWASGYDKYFTGMHYRVKTFLNIEVVDMDGINQVKQYLYNKNEPGRPGGIVTISSKAGNWKFDNNYSGPSETGYRCLMTKLSTTGAHAMTIVGYDDLIELTDSAGVIHKGAFIVANSHGTDCQDRGRFYLPYWFFLQEEFRNDLNKNVTGASVEFRNPRIVFKVGVDYTSRNDLSFRLGVSEKASDGTPLHDYIVPIINNQGGDFPMQGRGSSSEIEFAFDFSSHEEKMENIENPNYFLTIIRSEIGYKLGTGHLTSFAVYDYRKDCENPEIHTYRNIDGKEFAKGNNIFNIPTSEIPKCSYSPVKWLNDEGQPSAVPLIFKTADGKYVKVRFSEYDREKGSIKIKYVYSPDGSTDIR